MIGASDSAAPVATGAETGSVGRRRRRPGEAARPVPPPTRAAPLHNHTGAGQMRTPQEVPERAQRLVQASHALGFKVEQPADAGLDPLLAVHGAPYLTFLQEAHQRWKEIPEDWGDEVMSNIFVREPNALRGILAQAARYLADGSCPVAGNNVGSGARL